MSDPLDNDDRGLRERVAVLESSYGELKLVRQRVHDMVGSIQVLVANGEEAREARQELSRKVDALSAAISQAAVTMAQISTTMIAHGEQTRSLIDKVDRISAGMEQHDRRDDDRFNADGARLTAVEQHLELRAESDKVQHARHTTLQATAWTIIAMLVTGITSVVLTYLLMHR